MLKLYACVLYVERQGQESWQTAKTPYGITVSTVKSSYRAAPYAVLAHSKEEATGILIAEGREKCPPEDGWSHHEAHVLQVEDDMIRTAYKELTNA